MQTDCPTIHTCVLTVHVTYTFTYLHVSYTYIFARTCVLTVTVLYNVHLTCVLTVTVFYNIHLHLLSGREEKPLQFLDEQPSVPYVGKEYVGNDQAQVPSCIYVAILITSSCMYAHIQVLVIMCVCVCVCVCVSISSFVDSMELYVCAYPASLQALDFWGVGLNSKYLLTRECLRTSLGFRVLASSSSPFRLSSMF